MAVEYGHVGDGAELETYAALLNRCFGTSGEVEDSRDWLGRQRKEDLRTLRVDGQPIAALSLVSMGQFFGGRSIRTAGVAGVGIEPHARRRGHAKELMRSFLVECREAGYPLSTLHASTYGLYGSVGYGRAGGRWRLQLRPSELVLRDAPAAELRPGTEADEPALEDVWRRWARLHPGQLDRGEYVWRRVREYKKAPVNTLVVEGEQGVEGYVRWVQLDSKADFGPFDLVAHDFAVLTPDAGRRILRFFADHSSMASYVRWASGPGDPLLMLLPERNYELELLGQWMLRIVHVETALADRGYPIGVSAELSLEVEDEVLPENAGRFVLRVEDGRGTVARGGDGGMRLTAAGLAALYTGAQSPAQLAAVGQVAGDPRQIEAAAAVFAGPTPWMTDMF